MPETSRKDKEPAVNLCPHGSDPASCEACLFNQPSWERIRQLQGESRFRRSSDTSANCTIENGDGRKFTIETIESRNDERINEVRGLIENTFGRRELESRELLLAGIEGKSEWGTPDAKYRIVMVYNEKNELVSLVTGAKLDLLDDQQNPTNEAIYFVNYVATDPNQRRDGAGREAYVSALIDATREAQEKGQTLMCAIGDCTPKSELYWNKVGWKRPKQKNNEGGDLGDTLTALDYIQPPLNWDSKTGKPAKGAGEVVQHLMMDGFGRSLGKEDVKKVYLAFMDYIVGLPREAFDSQAAMDTQKNT